MPHTHTHTHKEVKRLPTKHKALSSNHSTTQNNNKIPFMMGRKIPGINLTKEMKDLY
jgi:hypothetical protein